MKKFNFKIKVKSWIKKETGAYIIYSKKFDLSAYGKTRKEAKLMLNEMISDIILSTKTKKK
jgi:hypothetical protein